MNPIDIILKFIPPTVLLAITGIAVVVASLFIHLYQGEVHAHAKFKADVLAQQVETDRENKRKLKEARDETKLSGEGWRAAVDYWRKHGGPVRVRKSSCDSGASAQATGAGLRLDETASAGLSSTTVDASRCEELINAGVRDAAQVLHLQEHIDGLCRTYGCE